MAADIQHAYRLLDQLGPASLPPWFICLETMVRLRRIETP